MIPFRRAVLVAAVLVLTFLWLRSGSPSPPSKLAQAPPNTTPAAAAATPHSPPGAAGSAKTQQKLSIASIKTLPLAQQLSYHFPYDIKAKFPAYIWQTWKYTPSSSQFSEKFRITEASWTEKHPTFVHEVCSHTARARHRG